MITRLLRLTLSVIAVTLTVAACGADTASTSAVPAASGAPPASTAGGSNPAQLITLTAAQLPRLAGTFKQSGDGLLAGAADTDARVFSTADHAQVLEIDVAGHGTAGEAQADFPAFQGAAANQVATLAASSAPNIGERAREFVGTDTGGRGAASVAFLRGIYTVVVTAKSAAGLVDPALVEAVAAAQDARIVAGA